MNTLGGASLAGLRGVALLRGSETDKSWRRGLESKSRGKRFCLRAKDHGVKVPYEVIGDRLYLFVADLLKISDNAA